MDKPAQFDNIQLEFHPDGTEHELEQHQECDNSVDQCRKDLGDERLDEPAQFDNFELEFYSDGAEYELE